MLVDSSRKNLMKAGSHTRSATLSAYANGGRLPPSSPQGTSVVKQQNKRSGPFGFPQEAGPLLTSLRETLEIWGAGGPPPLRLSLYLAIIATQPAFESEGVALRHQAAGLRR